MKYIAEDCQVVETYGGHRNIVATCNDSRWADRIARLLQSESEGDGSKMVRIEGGDLELLRIMLSGSGGHRKPYLLRVDQRGNTVAFKVNESIWTHGMGKHQPPY
jgi:hypothetical protein